MTPMLVGELSKDINEDDVCLQQAFDCFALEFHDIDKELDDAEKNLVKGEKNIEEEQEQVYFYCRREMRQYGKGNKSKFAPYLIQNCVVSHVTPKDIQVPAEQETSKFVKFRAQILFTNDIDQRQQLMFVGSHNYVHGDGEMWPQLPPQVTMDHQYPVMMRNTHMPLQNEVIVTNYGLNEPARLLNLGEYRFVCFLDTDPDCPFGSKNFTTVFFLIRHMDSNDIMLAMYDTEALRAPDTESSTTEDSVRVIMGKTSLLDDQQILRCGIKKATMLYNESEDGEKRMKLVLQCLRHIVVADMQKT